MTFRERLGRTNDVVAGSRILSYRIGKASPQSLPVVAAVRLPDPGRAAATRSRIVL